MSRRFNALFGSALGALVIAGTVAGPVAQADPVGGGCYAGNLNVKALSVMQQNIFGSVTNCASPALPGITAGTVDVTTADGPLSDLLVQARPLSGVVRWSNGEVSTATGTRSYESELRTRYTLDINSGPAAGHRFTIVALKDADQSLVYRVLTADLA